MLDIFIHGGPVMYPLLACSLTALTVIVERLLFWAVVDMRHKRPLVEEILELCRVGDWEQVRVRTEGSRDYMVRILVSGILHHEQFPAPRELDDGVHVAGHPVDVNRHDRPRRARQSALDVLGRHL